MVRADAQVPTKMTVRRLLLDRRHVRDGLHAGFCAVAEPQPEQPVPFSHGEGFDRKRLGYGPVRIGDACALTVELQAMVAALDDAIGDPSLAQRGETVRTAIA